MLTIVIRAYLLQGEPVMKTIQVKPSDIQATYQVAKYFGINNDKKFNCAIFFKHDYKGHDYLLTEETCESLDARRHKLEWE